MTARRGPVLVLTLNPPERLNAWTNELEDEYFDLLGGNVLTWEFKINYVAPTVGQSLVGRAVAKGVGKRQAVCQCEVYAIDGERWTLCAIAQGTVVSASRA
jgi:acyl-coenzyme A thioesterase PaaI-like protein